MISLKDEIKEILDNLIRYKNEDNKMKWSPEDILTIDDVWLLLDYITNLQEKLQQKENIIKEVREYIENHSITNIEWWITGKQKIECKFMKDTNPQELLEILDKPISKKSDNDF